MWRRAPASGPPISKPKEWRFQSFRLGKKEGHSLALAATSRFSGGWRIAGIEF